jgi:mannose-6-phosphate isomerase class I
MDGKPRPLHVPESLQTIDFSRTGFGPLHPPLVDDPRGGRTRLLADCRYFRLEERLGTGLERPAGDSCAAVVCLEGAGELQTGAGAVTLAPMQTVLVPAAAGAFVVTAAEPIRVLVAEPPL